MLVEVVLEVKWSTIAFLKAFSQEKEKSLIYELKDAEKSEDDEDSLKTDGSNTASIGKKVEIQDGEHNRLSEFDSDQQLNGGQSGDNNQGGDSKAEDNWIWLSK